MTGWPARIALAAAALVSLACGVARGAERDALIARWVAASRPSPSLRAQLHPRQPISTAPADLAALAAAELRIPRRYRLDEKAEAPKESLLQRAWNWVVDRLTDLWQAIFGRVRVGRGGAVVFGEALLVVLTVALVVGVWRLIAVVRIGRRRRVSVSEELDDEPAAREAYRRARDAARNGDFSRASRLLFVATVLALDLRGVVARDASATVGDLQRALRTRDQTLVPPFDAVATPFVRSAYAERPIGLDDWERARSAFLTILPDEAAG